MNFENKNYWALILGGSSGFGLATAKKLSSQGMNIFAVIETEGALLRKLKKSLPSLEKTISNLNP